MIFHDLRDLLLEGFLIGSLRAGFCNLLGDGCQFCNGTVQNIVFGLAAVEPAGIDLFACSLGGCGKRRGAILLIFLFVQLGENFKELADVFLVNMRDSGIPDFRKDCVCIQFDHRGIQFNFQTGFVKRLGNLLGKLVDLRLVGCIRSKDGVDGGGDILDILVVNFGGVLRQVQNAGADGAHTEIGKFRNQIFERVVATERGDQIFDQRAGGKRFDHGVRIGASVCHALEQVCLCHDGDHVAKRTKVGFQRGRIAGVLVEVVNDDVQQRIHDGSHIRLCHSEDGAVVLPCVGYRINRLAEDGAHHFGIPDVAHQVAHDFRRFLGHVIGAFYVFELCRLANHFGDGVHLFDDGGLLAARRKAGKEIAGCFSAQGAVSFKEEVVLRVCRQLTDSLNLFGLANRFLNLFLLQRRIHDGERDAQIGVKRRHQHEEDQKPLRDAKTPFAELGEFSFLVFCSQRSADKQHDDEIDDLGNDTQSDEHQRKEQRRNQRGCKAQERFLQGLRIADQLKEVLCLVRSEERLRRPFQARICKAGTSLCDCRDDKRKREAAHQNDEPDAGFPHSAHQRKQNCPQHCQDKQPDKYKR